MMEHNLINEKEEVHQLDSNSFISEKHDNKLNDFIPILSVDKINKRQICEADLICKVLTNKIIDLAFIRLRTKSIYEETPIHCFDFTKRLINDMLIEDNIFNDKETGISKIIDNDGNKNKNDQNLNIQAPELDFELELYGKNLWSKRFQPVSYY